MTLLFCQSTSDCHQKIGKTIYVRKIMVPKNVHMLILGIWKYTIMLHGKRIKFTDRIIFTNQLTLKWEYYLRLSKLAQCNIHKVSFKRQNNAGESESEILEETMLLSWFWRWNKGLWAEGHRRPLALEKAKKHIVP